MVTKPSSTEELSLPFGSIGDPGWAEALRQLLEAYEVPLPTPASWADLSRLEATLGFALPGDWSAFLRSFGPLNLEIVRFLPPDQIRSATDLWFRDFLDADEQAELASLLYLAETGSDNFFVYDTANAVIRLASHDPAGLFEWIPSLSHLLHYACAQLPAGYYGWPDDNLAVMVDQYAQDLLSKWWHSRPDA